MPGNTFGSIFRVTTWGESHGPAFGVVIDGCPPLLSLTEREIQEELDRRRPGQSAITTTRNEKDKVHILSGVFEGKTLGTPIAMMVENLDQQNKDYLALKNIYRPGHADIAWDLKYGIRDFRGGGRSSGRETISRVMAGAVAKKILRKAAGTKIIGYCLQIGPVHAKKFEEKEIEKNTLRCADKIQAQKMEKYILAMKEKGDSVGGMIGLTIQNAPIGLGEPIFDKLQADLGKALLSIATVKGIAFGSGFDAAASLGSSHNDELRLEKGKIRTKTNHAGGILGGISIGTDITIQLAIKPPSSIKTKQKTIDKSGKKVDIAIEGRHDPCIVPRLIPVAQSMVAITLVDHLLRQKTIA